MRFVWTCVYYNVLPLDNSVVLLSNIHLIPCQPIPTLKQYLRISAGNPVTMAAEKISVIYKHHLKSYYSMQLYLYIEHLRNNIYEFYNEKIPRKKPAFHE